MFDATRDKRVLESFLCAVRMWCCPPRGHDLQEHFFVVAIGISAVGENDHRQCDTPSVRKLALKILMASGYRLDAAEET